MSATRESYRRHRISVDAYHRMAEAGIFARDARIELINGEIIDMTPIGDYHISAVDRLTRLLVLGLGDKAIVRTQGSVRLDEFSEPEPDLLVLKPRDDFYRSESAGPSDVLLLIEVSDSSLRYDLDFKLPFYASTKVPEVWIVDLVNKQLHRHSKPVDGQWTAKDSPVNLTHINPEFLGDLMLDLSELFGE